MADGLGLTKEEWEELKSQVDDSFWVMRIIGMSYRNISLLILGIEIASAYVRIPSVT